MVHFRKRRKRECLHRGDPGVVTIHHANRVVIEGVERILYCDREKMILKNRFLIQISGQGLRLLELGNDNVAVVGRLDSLSFPEKEK